MGLCAWGRPDIKDRSPEQEVPALSVKRFGESGEGHHDPGTPEMEGEAVMLDFNDSMLHSIGFMSTETKSLINQEEEGWRREEKRMSRIEGLPEGGEEDWQPTQVLMLKNMLLE